MKKIIGELSPNKPVIIIGAGISGLLIAYYLKKANIPITVYEKESHPGGLIQTKTSEDGIIETAANSIILNDHVLELIEELKLTPLYPTKKLSRFILRQDKLKKFPLSFFETIQIIKNLSRQTSTNKNLSLADFFKPLFSRKIIDEVLSTAMGGIYSIPADEIDYLTLFDQAKGQSFYSFFKDYAKKKRKDRVICKKSATISFENGLGELVNALATNLKDQIKYGSTYEANNNDDNIIFTTDAQTTSKLVAHYPEIAKLLSEIEYLPLSTTTIFSKKKIPQLNNAFGVLCSNNSPIKANGILCNSEIFKNRSAAHRHSYTLIQPLKDYSAQNIYNDLLYLGLKKDDIVSFHHTSWDRGIPKYNLKRTKIIEKLEALLIKQNLKGLVFFGNYVNGISIREMIYLSKMFSQKNV